MLDSQDKVPGSAFLRVLLLALSPFPLLERFVTPVVGTGILAVVIVGLIRWLHWPEAVLPIALLLVALVLWAAVRLQRRLDETHKARIVIGEPEIMEDQAAGFWGRDD